ncbi:MAG: hypothetical protein IPL86_07250 [Flavobacteriales bacterium]|nr:hypothetical protein [Flavobacteriales bacterium]
MDEPHGLKFNVDGRDGLITAFDTGLMQPAGGTAFNEDSLVVLYRPNPATAWGVVPATINTIGSATDKYARLDMPNLNLGDYAIAWRSQPVGIGAVPVKTEGWRYFPDPANGSVSVLAPPAFPAGAYKVVVLDIQGRNRSPSMHRENRRTWMFPKNSLASCLSERDTRFGRHAYTGSPAYRPLNPSRK